MNVYLREKFVKKHYFRRKIDKIMTFLFLGTTEIIVIALIILLLFGGAKLPSLMKGIGKGVKQFKDATNGKFDDEDEQNKPKNEAQ